MPHPNERERVKYLIFLHSAVFWHQDRFMRGGKDRNNSTVTLLPHFKKTTPNSLPPQLSSTLTYLLFLPRSLLSSIFLFLSSFSRDHPFFFSAFFFICYSLNRGSLMSFTLTFFICQFVYLSHHHHHHPLPSSSVAISPAHRHELAFLRH